MLTHAISHNMYMSDDMCSFKYDLSVVGIKAVRSHNRPNLSTGEQLFLRAFEISDLFGCGEFRLPLRDVE